MPHSLKRWKKYFYDVAKYEGEITEVEKVEKANIILKGSSVEQPWEELAKKATTWGVTEIFLKYNGDKQVFTFFHKDVWYSATYVG